MPNPHTDAAAEPAVTPPPVPPATARRLWSAGVFAGALVLSVAVYYRLWADPRGRTPGSLWHTNDPMQTMWNLKWVPWQVLHGHSPFDTHAMYYPHGVSLSWNTLTPTLGLLAAPVTLTAGPAFAYSLLMTLAPALAALTSFWWLRRHVRRPAAAALGALVVGFSPYQTGHMLGHLNLTFIALVPLMLMLLEDLLWRAPRPAPRTAVYLGVVTAAQAGISEELIVIVAIGVAVAMLTALVVERARVLRSVRAALVPFALAVAVFAVTASPLLVHQLFLSPHVPFPGSWWSANAGDYLLPLPRYLLDPGWTHYSRLGGAENGAYLGVVLLAVLVAGVAMTWRDRTVRIAAVTLVVLVVLSLGALGPGGVWLPWHLVTDWPVLRSVLPVRFSFASWFVIAWLLARWTDRLLPEPSTTRPAPSRDRRAVAIGVIVLALVTLAPRAIGTYPLPARASFFTSAEGRALVPSGSAVLLLPSPTNHDASGMYYQAQADFRFDLPGGYALRKDGRGSSYGPPASPLVRLSAQAFENARPAFEVAEVDAGRAQLAGERYRAIVVVDTARNAPAYLDLAERLTGRAADRVRGGVHVWLLDHPPSSRR